MKCPVPWGVRIAIPDRKIDCLTFSSYGEGAFYPQHFRYFAQGKKFVAKEIEVVSGTMKDPCNLLSDDSRFAVMGSDDGKAY